MSSIHIQTSKGETMEVTIATMFNMLADETSCSQVIGELNRRGILDVMLKDGPAKLIRPGFPPTGRNHPGPPQTGLGLGEYVADTILSFSVPARFYLRANTPDEVRHRVMDFVYGRTRPPPDFNIELDGDGADEFFSGLRKGDYSTVREVQVLQVAQRASYPLQLTHGA